MPVIFIKGNEELTVTEFCNLGPFLALKADDRVWLAGNFDKALVTSVCHYALLRKACEAVQSWLGIRDVRGKAAVTWASKRDRKWVSLFSASLSRGQDGAGGHGGRFRPTQS